MNPLDYQLAEILMFSPETYYRMIELYNRAIWPAQFIALIVGLMTIAICFYKHRYQGRILASVLAASWAWMSYGFLWKYYATINWYAVIYTFIYAMQAVILIWLGIVKDRIVPSIGLNSSSITGMILLTYAILIHPALTGVYQSLWHAEVAGLLPVPTLIATMGVILLAKGAPVKRLLAIPFLSAIVGGATAWELETYEALAGLIAAIPAFIVIVSRK